MYTYFFSNISILIQNPDGICKDNRKGREKDSLYCAGRAHSQQKISEPENKEQFFQLYFKEFKRWKK